MCVCVCVSRILTHSLSELLQSDRGSIAAEWADDTSPTDTPDEGSNAERGRQQSTIAEQRAAARKKES